MRPVISLLILLLLMPATSRADIQWLGSNRFIAGVPDAEFEFFAAPNNVGRQRQANWCWAAAVQMVLNYHGLVVNQEQIVARIFGELIDKPGRPDQILAALSGWAPDSRGRFSQVLATPYIFQGSDIVEDLAYKWPLIVGLIQPGQPIGHAYVLTAVTYSVNQFNQPIFDSVVLRDPWPGSPSKVELSWREFQSRLMFAARVSVNRM